MVNATGLHPSQVLPIDLKIVWPFDTKILRTLWGTRGQAGRKRSFSASCAQVT